MTMNDHDPTFRRNPEDVQQFANQHPMEAVRGHAIVVYAEFEQCLCRLFAHLGNVEYAVAGIIFFQISSTKTIYVIIDRLIRKRFGSTYNVFWNQCLKDMRAISHTRNKIVHWINSPDISEPNIDGTRTVSAALSPPAMWEVGPGQDKLYMSQIVEFIQKCEVYSRVCNLFTLCVVLGEVPLPSPNIFLEPLTYPPREDHPLFPTLPTHDNPPQSSPP